MKHPTTLASMIALVMSGTAAAQLAVRPAVNEAYSVTNDGLVSIGHSTVTITIWDPDLGTAENIGGTLGGLGQGHFSADGQRLSGSAPGALGTEMASYDLNTGHWTTHGNLGVLNSGWLSGGTNISGDGKTVVGAAVAISLGGDGTFDTYHAVAWNNTEGLMDLGSLYGDDPIWDPGTRANAVNADGGIVVGWQQITDWSDRKSAVWVKDPDGGYFPNTYILIDPDGDPASASNQAGQCTAISADGSVIGGRGDEASGGQPWIWSEAGGFMTLGMLPGMSFGSVKAMSANGAIVVGYCAPNDYAEDVAFIWTAATGLQDLNAFVTETLGVDLGSQQLRVASDISPNGLYICGRGSSPLTTWWFAFRLSLGGTTGLASTPRAEPLHAWPNPVTDVLHLRGPGPGELRILGVDGAVVERMRVAAEATVDLAHLAAGVYTMVLNDGQAVHAQRIVKQ